MSKLYVFGEDNNRGEISPAKFSFDTDFVLNILEKSLLIDEDELEEYFSQVYEMLLDDMNYSKSTFVVSLLSNWFLDDQGHEYIKKNINNIKNDIPFFIEMEESNYGVGNTKQKAIYSFNMINFDDNEEW